MQEYEEIFMYIFIYIALQVCIDPDISVNNKTFLMTTEKKGKKNSIKYFSSLASPIQS